jgi:hypothetical protein
MAIPAARSGMDKTIPSDRTAARAVEVDNDGGDAGPDDISVQDWIEAEKSRPTLPDETADGLDDMDEEVRHQAEDLPLDKPGRG